MSYEAQADAILANRSTGQNGTVAYTLANEKNEKGIPVYNRDNPETPRLYFAIMETNRVGVTVAAPPGGTQDIIATLDEGEPLRVELDKEKGLHAVLKTLGETIPEGIKGAALDHLIVQKLLEHGYAVRLETPFEAALRETGEEHGLIIAGASDYVGTPAEFRVGITAKRSIQRAKRQAGHCSTWRA